ncbi:MAG: hypothetical protein AB7P33_13825 [Dehalococcoidia bacterium]
MRGAISRLANTHGSTWGKIRPKDIPREIFFNAASLHHGHDFQSLVIGQEVEFEEELDRTNGTRAVSVRTIAASAG